MSNDTRYPLSERLYMASRVAFDRGNIVIGLRLAGDARQAFLQECDGRYEQRMAAEKSIGRERER